MLSLSRRFLSTTMARTEKLVSINPRTNAVVQQFKEMPPDEVSDILLQVNKKWDSGWRKVSIAERCGKIRNIGSLLRENLDECAQLISVEMGKNVKEAEGEVKKCAMLCDYFADNGEAFTSPLNPTPPQRGFRLCSVHHKR